MSNGPPGNVSRVGRFVASLVPAFLLFGAFFGIVLLVSQRIEGLAGVGIGILAGGSLVSGVLLAYWNLVDWLNLRVIRRVRRTRASALRDGEIVAFEGVVRIDGEPMTAPISGTPCAAYTYRVKGSHHSSSRGGSVSYPVAFGFHMVRTRIEGATRSLRLRSFPSFEDALREDTTGRQRGAQVRSLLASLAGDPGTVGRGGDTRLLEARHGDLDEVHHDDRVSRLGGRVDGLAVTEEVLPLGERVTVVGTYEQERQGLSARRSRIGPNLMVYNGGADEVLARVGREQGWYARVAVALIAVGTSIVFLALPPAVFSSALALIGRQTGAAAGEAASRRDRIDEEVRHAYAPGRPDLALALAIDANTPTGLRWLLAQGVAPDTPMRVGDEGMYQRPLVEASRLGHLELVRVLLEAGANPDASQPSQFAGEPALTALGEAVARGHCDVAALLRASGAREPGDLEANRCP